MSHDHGDGSHGDLQPWTSEDFTKFCESMYRGRTGDEKIKCLIAALRWIKPNSIRKWLDPGLDDGKEKEAVRSVAIDEYITAVSLFGHFLRCCSESDLPDWINAFVGELQESVSAGGAGSELLDGRHSGQDPTSMWLPRSIVAVGVDTLHRQGRMSLEEIKRYLNHPSFCERFPNLDGHLLRYPKRRGQKDLKSREDGEIFQVTIGGSAISWWRQLKDGEVKNPIAQMIWEAAPRAADGGTLEQYKKYAELLLFGQADKFAEHAKPDNAELKRRSEMRREAKDRDW